MFSIFKKNHIVRNIEWLGVDMHSHLLPGLDDGSPDLIESVSHHDKHLNALTTVILDGYLYKKLSEYPFKNTELFL